MALGVGWFVVAVASQLAFLVFPLVTLWGVYVGMSVFREHTYARGWLFLFLFPWFTLEDAGWPLALVLPLTDRPLLQPGWSPELHHPQGCLLVLPCRNSRRRRRTAIPAKHAPLYPRTTSERGRRLRLREHREHPDLSVSTALTASTKVFTGAAFGGT